MKTSNPSAFVSVLEYGAVADGTTDNTAAFTAAFDALVAIGGGVAVVPAGNFSFSGSISLPPSVSLLGVCLMRQ